MKILNSLSLNMYDGDTTVPVTRKLTPKDVMDILWIPAGNTSRYIGVSCIGHTDLCKILSKEVGEDILPNRITLHFKAGDTCLIAQYIGQRLPEGCTELPSGSKIVWYSVSFQSRQRLESNASVADEAAALAHSVAGWGLQEEEVLDFLKKHFPVYFQDDFFE